MNTEEKCPSCNGTQSLSAENWFGVCGNVWHRPYSFETREQARKNKAQQDLIHEELEQRAKHRESERKLFDGGGYGVFSNQHTVSNLAGCTMLKFFSPNRESAEQFFNEEVEDFKKDDSLMILQLKMILCNPAMNKSQAEGKIVLKKNYEFETLEEKLKCL